MRSSKWLMFVLLLAAIGPMSACAATFRNASWTYENGGYDRDDDRYDRSNHVAYRDGLRQGRYDAERRLSSRPYESRWRAYDDRRAYSAGYIRAYRDVQDYRDHGRDWNRDRDRDHDWDRDHDRDRDRDRDHDGDRDRTRVGNGYGQGSTYYRDMAKQTGYQDGQRDGAHDKQSGHSFRPTQMDNYKNADRGFRDDMGDKDSYKLAYREGYSSGYKNGWDTNTRR